MISKAEPQIGEPGLFTVRDRLLCAQNPREGFFQSLLEAKRFIDSITIEEVLKISFAAHRNRRTVIESLLDIVHVGFTIRRDDLSFESMVDASRTAGFSSGHAEFPSAVVSRELGELVGCEEIPTTFFTAGFSDARGRRRYFEVFIPAAEPALVRKWIDDEVGTHIGFTLGRPEDLQNVHGAFLSEGFAMPKFMRGEPITNFENGVTVAYYEKQRGARKVRLEIVFKLEGAAP